MNARDLGVADDPFQTAAEDVRPHLGLPPAERYRKFLDLMSFLESIWRTLEPSRRARSDEARDALDRPGPWWERVPRQ